MFGGMKEKAREQALKKFEEEIAQQINEKIELFSSLRAIDVQNDEKYRAIVVQPLWVAVKVQSGGAIEALKAFVDVDSKFDQGLFHVRDELIMVEGDQVALAPDFDKKVGPTLLEAFR